MFGAKRFVRAGGVVPGTSLLPVPFAIASVVIIFLVVTLTLDTLASSGRIALPSWLSVGNVDDARAILGAVSTVLALIFSVTLLVFSMVVSSARALCPIFSAFVRCRSRSGFSFATFAQLDSLRGDGSARRKRFHSTTYFGPRPMV